MSLLRPQNREFTRIWSQKRATLLFSAVRFDGGRARGPCSFGGYNLPAIYFFTEL